MSQTGDCRAAVAASSDQSAARSESRPGGGGQEAGRGVAAASRLPNTKPLCRVLAVIH